MREGRLPTEQRQMTIKIRINKRLCYPRTANLTVMEFVCQDRPIKSIFVAAMALIAPPCLTCAPSFPVISHALPSDGADGTYLGAVQDARHPPPRPMQAML